MSNASPDRPTVTDSLLIKQRNKLQKALADIAQLEKRQRAQEALDAGQRAKLGRKAEAEEALRQVHLQGTAEQRERLFGVCGKSRDCRLLALLLHSSKSASSDRANRPG